MQQIQTLLNFGGFKASACDLGWARVIYCVYLVFFHLPRGLFVQDIPASIMKIPRGLTQLSLFVPVSGIAILHVILVVLACWIAIGVRVRLLSILLGLTLLALNAIVYSTGKIEHDILLVLTPFLMAPIWGPSGHESESTGDNLEPRWQLTVLAVLLGILMLSSAWPKFRTGWLSFDTQSVLGFCIKYAGAEGRLDWGLNLALRNMPLWMWELQDWAAVLLEFAILPAVLFPKLFRSLLFVVVMFHLGVLIQMDLAYSYQLPVYAVFVPWGRLFKWRAPNVAGSPGILCISAIIAGTSAMLMLVRGQTIIGYSLFTGARLSVVAAAMIACWVVLMLPWSTLRQSLASPDDRDHPSMLEPVIFFDGVCGLCNGWVDFVLKHDQKQEFRFAALQSEVAAAELTPDPGGEVSLNSIVYCENGVRLAKSDAVLAIFGRLGWPWRVMVVFLAIPRSLRDFCYDRVAALRYKMFGKRETCRVPTSAERQRFLV